MQQMNVTLSVTILSVKQMKYYTQTCIKRHSVAISV